MNKVELMGRVTRDPDVRYTQGQNSTAVARFSIAVDRKFKKDGEPTADFPKCIAFGKIAEIIEKYVFKGTKIVVIGRIQTSSFTDKDGNKTYSTDVIVEEIEFAESKASANANAFADGIGNINMPVEFAPSQNADPIPAPATQIQMDSFMNIPDNMDELPFD